MSDQSQGPGWWLASDGKWYPPDQAPAVPPETWGAPPVGPPPGSGMSTGAKVAIAVGGGIVALIVLSVIALQFLGEETTRSFQSTGTAIDEADSDGTDAGGTDDGGDGATPVAPADLPDGYAVIQGDGVSIATPDHWEEVAPEDFAMSDEDFAAAFPDAPEGMIEQGTAFFDKGAVLVAFDFTRADFSSNVNVIDAPGEVPMGILEAQIETQIESLGGTLASLSRVDLPVGEAVRVEYSLDVALPDGSSTQAQGVQFYVPLDGRTYVITVTSDEDVSAMADQMIETFRVD